MNFHFYIAEFFNTEVRSITLPDKEKLSDQYKYIKEAVKAYPELYFAKLVILGEGDSEEIILPKFPRAKYNFHLNLDEDFRMNTPSIIQRIIKRIEELLGKEEVKITQ